jgi:sulfate adenylyltransferase
MREDIDSNASITLSWEQYQDTINIATGRFSPLKGFLDQNDLRKVVADKTLEDGIVWPLPITLDVSEETTQNLSPGNKAALRSPEGDVIGAIDVSNIYKPNKEQLANSIFGTADRSHPGVANFLDKAPFFVSGPIYLFSEHRYNGRDLLPAESRVLFRKRGWDTVVGFQTRNAPHRGHEYLQRCALEQADGLLVQPKFGTKKANDYRDEVILDAYDLLFEHYYRSDRVALSVFPSKMNYAGPREAVFDAIVRKNQGCTHFVVGRDHAGVGDYYGEFEAQQIFEELSDIGIEIIAYDYSFYCERCDGMTSRKICPHDDEQRVYPSGTKIRKTLRNGQSPSDKMMRPEVAAYIVEQEDPFVTAGDPMEAET